MRNELLL